MFAVFVTLTIVRLILPVTIIKWPLVGFGISLLIDGADWFLWQFHSYADYERYQSWDKWLDLYMLSIAFYTTLFWKGALAKRVAGGLFFYRILGILLFELTSLRTVLFFFPNLFESWYLFCNAFRRFAKREILFTSGKFIALALIILLLPKLYMEYHLHISQIDFWAVLKRFFTPEYRLEAILLSTYITMPVGLLYFTIRYGLYSKQK